MNVPTVLQKEASTSGYRSAVATIIRDIQTATGHTLIDIAENIDASRDTVADAKEERTSLNAVHLARLGQVYGAAYLNPYLALMGAQAAPLERKKLRDILPITSRFLHKVHCARDPDGPGGATEVIQERAGYLPDAKELHRELGCQINEIEGALA